MLLFSHFAPASSLSSGSNLCLYVTVLFVCVRVCFSSAGVQSVRACEQKRSRVEEKGGRPAHREADLQWLLASGETFYVLSVSQQQQQVKEPSRN